MRISIPDDSGNIEIINAVDAQNIRLKIRSDNKADCRQWFNFVVEGAIDEAFTLVIEDADPVSHPVWDDAGGSYRATATANDQDLPRLDTTFDKEKKTLTIRGTLTNETMQIAFFRPYPYGRHLALIEIARTIPNCIVSSLGQSVEGRDITLLTIGTPGPAKKNIWVIARQYPGETMAEWYAEGLIEHLAAGGDILPTLDENAVLYIVPNMNPDGSYLGHCRTNAAGEDLNRQWDIYDNQDTAPEVYYVRKAMLKEGVAAFFDIHGDETNPYVFPDARGLGCTEHPEMMTLEAEFLEDYIALQPESKYKQDHPGQANLNMASTFFAERLGCLSFVLEMPNKELASGQDWTANDCKQFGANLVDPLIKLIPKLSNKKLMDETLQAPRGFSFLEEKRKPHVVQVETTEDTENRRVVAPAGCCTLS